MSDAPPPPPPPPSAGPAAASKDRGALLGSIQNFSKGKLKKAVTKDASGPMLSRAAVNGGSTSNGGSNSGPPSSKGMNAPPSGGGGGGYGLLATLGNAPMPKLRSVQRNEAQPA